MIEEWTKEEADKVYGFSKWGAGFFDVNPDGNLCVLPDPKDNSVQIKLPEVVAEMKAQGIRLPAVIRFHDILRQQVKKLNRKFRETIDEADYEGKYIGVYPVKVNQMREVVEEIIDAGAPYDFGLEAGSKPELLAALAMNVNKNSLTILNGYKDEEYLKLALMGRKLQRNVLVVIEKFTELEPLLRLADEMKVKPLIGIRAKMSIKGHGKWENSSGERAKFGLSVAEIINLVNKLKEEGKEDCLKLLHFHMGSQVTNIRSLKEAVNEGVRIYVELHKMGIDLEYFDVGGGLGVDYDGTRSTNHSSMNYTADEYVADVVYGLKQVCDLEGVPHPNIVSESGRAITAHHSCVVTKVIGKVDPLSNGFSTKKTTGEHYLVGNMRDILEELNEESNYHEMYNDACKTKSDCLNAFKLGVVSLSDRAKVEALFNEVARKIRKMVEGREDVPEALSKFIETMSPQYLCNFSVFQSTADSWAIKQLLPIMPIEKVNVRPTVRCTLGDITCDSDGKIDNFIDGSGKSNTVLLHDLESQKDEYHIGIFLTGAYQDVMGDMHNLFGRLNEVHVFCDDDDPSDFYIEEVILGQSAEKVLSTMQYNPEFLALTLKREVDKQVHRGNIPPREGVRLVDFYEDCLKSYTYLN